MKDSAKNNPFVIVIIELILICLPIFLLAIALFMEGAHSTILKKPEWSFISILFCVEILRDLRIVAASKNIGEQQTEAGSVFYAVLITIATMVLLMDFRHASGNTIVPTEAIYIAKFSLFGLVAFLFSIKRLQRIKVTSHK